jgi:hypothetical protein
MNGDFKGGWRGAFMYLDISFALFHAFAPQLRIVDERFTHMTGGLLLGEKVSAAGTSFSLDCLRLKRDMARGSMYQDQVQLWSMMTDT